MKNFIAKILVLINCLIFTACPSSHDEMGHKYITIANKSDIKIRTQMTWSITINQADTLWNCRLPALAIEINSSRQFESGDSHRGKSWEDDFKIIPYIQFLIFDAAVYDEYIDYGIPCAETTYTIPALQRYQLKLADLQRMNWIVVYPPEQ